MCALGNWRGTEGDTSFLGDKVEDRMVKINGKEYKMSEDDSLIVSLVKEGQLKEENGEYFWTKKALKDSIKSSIRLIRKWRNPFWRFYYKFLE